MAHRKINFELLPPAALLLTEAEKVEENPLPPTEPEIYEVVRYLYEVKRQTWTQIENFFYKQSGDRVHFASGAMKNLYFRNKQNPPQLTDQK